MVYKYAYEDWLSDKIVVVFDDFTEDVEFEIREKDGKSYFDPHDMISPADLAKIR